MQRLLGELHVHWREVHVMPCLLHRAPYGLQNPCVVSKVRRDCQKGLPKRAACMSFWSTEPSCERNTLHTGTRRAAPPRGGAIMRKGGGVRALRARGQAERARHRGAADVSSASGMRPDEVWSGGGWSPSRALIRPGVWGRGLETRPAPPPRGPGRPREAPSQCAWQPLPRGR